MASVKMVSNESKNMYLRRTTAPAPAHPRSRPRRGPGHVVCDWDCVRRSVPPGFHATFPFSRRGQQRNEELSLYATAFLAQWVRTCGRGGPTWYIFSVRESAPRSRVRGRGDYTHTVAIGARGAESAPESVPCVMPRRASRCPLPSLWSSHPRPFQPRCGRVWRHSAWQHDAQASRCPGSRAPA